MIPLSLLIISLVLLGLMYWQRIRYNNRCFTLLNFTLDKIRNMETLSREESVTIMNCAIDVYNDNIKSSTKMGYFPLVHERKNDSKK